MNKYHFLLLFCVWRDRLLKFPWRYHFQWPWVTAITHLIEMWIVSATAELLVCYGRPLSVSGRPCYILPMFFLFIFYGRLSPALVNGGSRKFYTWWTLSVIREVSSWIFSWSPLNYRVGQKVTKFGVFSDRTRKLSALTPERGRIL